MSPVEYELVASNYPHLKLPRQYHMLGLAFRALLEPMSPDELVSRRSAIIIATDGRPGDYFRADVYDGISKLTVQT